VRFAFIAAEKATYGVARLCRVMRVSRSGFYAADGRAESRRAQEDRRLAVLCRETFARSRRTYGSPRIHAELREHGEHVSRKRIVRLMRDEGLRARVRRRFVRTTDSEHALPVAPNLLAREFWADGPNQRWAGDVTFLRTPHGWLYLALVVDIYSRFIVGWATSAINDRRLVIAALDMALRRRRPGRGLLHHSDRGSPYASADYQKLLEHAGIICSMSRPGDCYDNALVESCIGTIKAELGEEFPSHAEGRSMVFDYIETFYNPHRRHSALGFISPAEYEWRTQEARAA
jgi:transposase InsO family protein